MSAARTILFVHGANEWYGSDYVLFEIVRAVQQSEFVPMVFLPDDVVSELPEGKRLSGRLAALGVETHVLPLAVLRRKHMSPGGALQMLLRKRAAVKRSMTLLADRDVSLVHSHTLAVQSGADIAARIRAPHLWHVSEIVQRPAHVRRYLARRAGTADRVVAVSAAVQDHLLETEPDLAQRIVVVRNGLDASRFDGVDGSAIRARIAPRGVPVVGMIGRIGTWKGQELLIRAARTVLREFPSARFYLVGGVLDRDFGAVERLRTLARSEGVERAVAFDEFTTDVPAALAAMDVFVLPSARPDPLPTTVLEAMASGLPVVATAHGGAPEMVLDGITGLLTPPGDAEKMGAAINQLLGSTELRATMGAAGRERVRSAFSMNAFSSAYLKMYRDLSRRAPI